MSVRTVLFWAHLLSALVAGVVIFIMSFTGVLLTYEKQMLAWADKRAANIAAPPHPTPRAPLADMLIAVRAASPGAHVTAITRRADAQAPITMALSNGKTVMLHPHSGEILGEVPATLRSVFRTTTAWHRYLAGAGEQRALGKAITGASNLAFLFVVISGVYLWIPRRWAKGVIAAVAIPRWRHATGRARDFNWHNALGLWSAIPLAIVVASATVISYPWASDLAYRVVGETPPARPAASAAAARPQPAPALEFDDVDARWEQAESRVPAWQTIVLRLPGSATAPLAFTIDEGSAGQPQKRSTLTVDARSGAEIRWETFAEQSAGRRLRSLLRFAHTGEVLGIPGQTIAGLASAAACVLVVTGFALATRRFMAWRRRSAPQSLAKAA